MNSSVIAWLSFVWATVHDFVYIGIYAALVHFHVLSHKKTVEERLAVLEKLLNVTKE
jgi:hypothetical protein